MKPANLGEAAHITAASPAGARYDQTLSPEQRRSPENGIWLCWFHARQVDRDTATFTADDIRAWKARAEKEQLERVEGRGGEAAAACARCNKFAVMKIDVAGTPVYLSWHGPHEELTLKAARTVGEAELGLIHCALVKDAFEPVQPYWTRPSSPDALVVWQVDEIVETRDMLRRPHSSDRQEYL